MAVWPLTRRLYRRPLLPFALGHLAGALSFGLAWLVGEYLLNSLLFGPVHAGAVLQAVLLWRGIVGVAVYAAMAIAFNAVLQAERRGRQRWRRPRPRPRWLRPSWRRSAAS